MDTDLSLTVGICLAVVTLPALFSGWVEERLSRSSLIILAAAVVLIAAAVFKKPGGYALAEIPHVMLSVLARIW